MDYFLFNFSGVQFHYTMSHHYKIKIIMLRQRFTPGTSAKAAARVLEYI